MVAWRVSWFERENAHDVDLWSPGPVRPTAINSTVLYQHLAAYPLPPSCAQVLVAQKVTAGVYKGVTTTELDELAAETAAALTSTHPDYATVGQ